MTDYVGLFRLYFNHRKAFPNVWSIDRGDPSSEVHCSHVIINVAVQTHFAQDTKDQPRCWLYGYGRIAQRKQKGADIIIISPR